MFSACILAYGEFDVPLLKTVFKVVDDDLFAVAEGHDEVAMSLICKPEELEASREAQRAKGIPAPNYVPNGHTALQRKIKTSTVL